MREKSSKPWMVESFKNSCKLLLKSRKSLLCMYLINYLMSFQYYVLVTLIPIFFSSEFAFSDFESGLVYGCFGVIIGIFSIYLSSILHVITLKKGLLFSSLLGIFGFFLMIFKNSYLALFAVLLVQAISCALSWPFIEYGIKVYSTEETRTISSSCYFITNYFAGITAGTLIDLTWTKSDYTAIFSINIIGLALAFLMVLYCENVENYEKTEINLVESVSQIRFWKFCGLILLLTLLRSACFGHLDATLPKYMIRVFGEKAHFGLMLAIHSITMTLGIFCFTILTYSFSSYTLIIIGAGIGSLGSGFLIFMDNLWAVTAFVIFISIGESIWVPRLLDYTFFIAPTGQEGIYLAISNCPFYFGMILTGITSGTLLDTFCPEFVNQGVSCNKLWIAVFFASIWIPITLFLIKKWICDDKNQGKKEEIVDYEMFDRVLSINS